MIFTAEFIEVIKGKALEFTKTSTPSTTLKKAMTASYRKLPRGHQIIVHIPHYWAEYYHDGSGPVSMPKGRYMVWFRNPKDDPRLKGGYPVKSTDVKRLKLTREQFTRYIKEGKLIVRQHVGRRKGAFFTRGAYRLWGPWIRRELREAALREIRNIFEPLRKIREI